MKWTENKGQASKSSKSLTCNKVHVIIWGSSIQVSISRFYQLLTLNKSLLHNYILPFGRSEYFSSRFRATKMSNFVHKVNIEMNLYMNIYEYQVMYSDKDSELPTCQYAMSVLVPSQRYVQ